VRATEKLTSFVYQVLSRGDVLISKFVSVAGQKSHVFKFLASFLMAPKADLIVYYMREDAEMVSDHTQIEFGNQLNNFVSEKL
jgi:hypothetical protein